MCSSPRRKSMWTTTYYGRRRLSSHPTLKSSNAARIERTTSKCFPATPNRSTSRRGTLLIWLMKSCHWRGTDSFRATNRKSREIWWGVSHCWLLRRIINRWAICAQTLCWTSIQLRLWIHQGNITSRTSTRIPSQNRTSQATPIWIIPLHLPQIINHLQQRSLSSSLSHHKTSSKTIASSTIIVDFPWIKFPLPSTHNCPSLTTMNRQ